MVKAHYSKEHLITTNIKIILKPKFYFQNREKELSEFIK